MPVQTLPLSEALPRSHYFVTLSRGSTMRTIAIRSALLHLCAGLVPILAVLGLGSSLYWLFRDDIVAEMMRRQRAMQVAYEDRIEDLRQDLDRQAERSRSESTKLDQRIHAVAVRQAELAGRALIVTGLAADAGLDPRASARPVPAATPSLSPKPRPVVDRTGEPQAPDGARRQDRASLLDDPDVPTPVRLEAADRDLDGVERSELEALARIGDGARAKAARVESLIEATGLSVERFMPARDLAAMGGPAVPLPDGAVGAFDRAVAEARAAVSTDEHLMHALPGLPVASPFPGPLEVTSPFGPRIDPFLGRPFLHTGVDLRESEGTEIRATAAGRVVSAGPAGGYGNLVEIDHGDGLRTRYAHMSAIAVAAGQTVARGAVLGEVGETGRATGPHLHYEVRVDGEPVDPMRFLSSADRLASLTVP